MVDPQLFTQELRGATPAEVLAAHADAIPFTALGLLRDDVEPDRYDSLSERVLADDRDAAAKQPVRTGLAESFGALADVVRGPRGRIAQQRDTTARARRVVGNRVSSGAWE